MILESYGESVQNNRCYFLLIGLLITMVTSAQSLLIVDASSNQPISAAQLYENASLIATSNRKGNLSLDNVLASRTYRLIATGYESILVNGNVLLSNKEISLSRKRENLPVVLLNSGNRLNIKSANDLRKRPQSVALITSEDINRADPFILTSVMERQPGVVMQEAALNTTRISIRGVGSRSQFSTNRIKAYFGNIPLTTVEGETVLEDVPLQTISSIEIIKGPNSNLYGSGLGGLIYIEPQFATRNELNTTFTYGSFNTRQSTTSTSISSDAIAARFTYNNLQRDGYRANSKYDRESFVLTGLINPMSKNKLNFIVTYTDLKAFIPSSLTRTNFETDPERAAFTWGASQGFESYKKLLAGLNYEVKLNQRLKNNSSVFLNYRIGFEPRPFNVLDEERTGVGARSIFSYSAGNKTATSNYPLQLKAGVEAQTERYQVSLFENLYEDFPDSGSVPGARIAGNEQDRYTVNGFLQADYNLSPQWNLEAGINVNTTGYELSDRFDDDVDQTGDYTFDTIFSPRLAALYTLNTHTNVYASLSHGYSQPTVGETLLPDGLINTNLQSETGWNYEVGIKSSFLDDALYMEATAYTVQINDLIVARNIGPDQFTSINAGSTDHNGLELLAEYNWKLRPDFTVIPRVSASINAYSFDDFTDGDNSFDGNDLTGVPRHVVTSSLDLRSKKAALFLSYRHQGDVPLNDANTGVAYAYDIMNARASYEFSFSQRWNAVATAGVNNIFDERYAASIVPNAVGFGGREPRAFYPGNPRNYYLSLSVSYMFDR